ncbi:sterol regulatory element binding protein cleavage-activating protein [Lentinula aciculospora]|uniref:Sterol regulatory element-binding protein cleavage-activating protein n=1 Tax=Lentinula aciculospora TaxID=153920 RepID=A0A9W9A7R6_9AGAR|nr:sterol regulatory element binding protein cleavage-activating protein [Lentinula aciculospora]
MLQLFPVLLQLARTYGQRFFLKFGLHCATHQIRIILVSCVVITSLFYPALALYSSQTKSISIFDALISPNSSVHAQQDLAELWSGHDSLYSREDAVSRAQCGNGRTVRIERLLVQSSLSTDNSVLDHGTLLSTLNFERKLEEFLRSSRQLTCLQKADGKCFVLSPLEFWGHDRDMLMADSNILDKLSSLRSAVIDGIPVTPDMVLAGRSDESTFDFANFLALTYFFPQSGCLSTSEHAAWLQAVDAAAGQEAELRNSSQEPSIIALEFGPYKGRSAISVFLYLSYASFFAYVFWSMRQMNSVHSRIGIVFTAMVEIVVSTITSLSVCALVGFKVTMVPWELLPIVIVFVGAENMFNLVDVVSRTSVTLTVKQRIAEGLSRAGTSNTLKVVSYNAILGVLAVFSIGSIRQFCVFAIVVLVAHWFLAHTFFLAVLSIDMQRLELEELLRQDSGSVPLTSSEPENVPVKSHSTWRNLSIISRKLLKGRATKNLSLVLLLAITATLYYATMPPGSVVDASIDPQTAPRGALFRTLDNGSQIEDMSSDVRIWKLFNPNDAVLHLQIEPATFLTFRPNADHHPNSSSEHRNLARTLRSVVWLLKIMLLPIAATTFLLWLLCLYLLKDAELLDAQQNRAEAPSFLSKEDPSALERHVSFSTLPRAFSSDVELIATSTDGRVAVSVGLHNEVIIWRTDSARHFSIDVSDILLRSPSSSSAQSTLTIVAMDDNGDYCAVGTGAGVIAVWEIRNDNIRSLPHLSLPDSSAGVVEMKFVPNPTRARESCSPTSNSTSPVLAPSQSVQLVVTYENGTVTKYAVRDLSGLVYVQPSRSSSVVRSKLVCVKPENRLVVAFCLNDGSLELFDVGDTNAIIRNDFYIQAGNPLDTITAVHICSAPMAGENRIIVAAATEAGVISLWDGQTGDCIRVLEEAYGQVNQLRVSLIPAETCRSCGYIPSDSFLLSFAVDQIVRFYKQFVTASTRRCTCGSTATLLKKTTRDHNKLGRRSRSSSISSSVSTSPVSRIRQQFPDSDVSPFPVSGHGVHSRRASEKESGRRNYELYSLQADRGEGTTGPLEVSRFPSLLWQDAYIIYVGDTTCDRGGWDIYDDGKIVGVRRKPRGASSSNMTHTSSTIKSLSAQGLPLTTLDRWEIWSFDPSATLLQSSSLLSILVINNNSNIELDHLPPSHPSPLSSQSTLSKSSSSPSSRCSNIPRLPFTRVTPFIVARSCSFAGFGNTLGVFKFMKL